MMKYHEWHRLVWAVGFVGIMAGFAGDVRGAEPPRAGEQWIVRDGKPQAPIVIAESPPRMTKLAATELQSYIEMITDAHLPIGTVPQSDLPITIYVGRSPGSDARGLQDAALKDGAYRIVPGEGWLALFGRDRDYEPKEPWARNNSLIPKMWEQWDHITSNTWG